MSAIGEPQTFKQPSRKGKKAWRKNVDVTEIQSGLEHVREEIIQTGGVIKEQPDSSLFVLDTAGDAVKASKLLGPSARKLKSDEILASRSRVPALAPPKKHGVTDGVTGEAKRRRISSAELTRLKRAANSTSASLETQKRGLKSSGGAEIVDPWADAEPEESKVEKKMQGLGLDFLSPPKPVKAPETLRHRPVNLAKAVESVPAVRLPDAGISYNPEFEKWDELLRTEGEKAVEEEKRRLAEEAEEKRLRELAALPEPEPEVEEEEEEESSDESDEEGEDKNKKSTEPKRKTQAQRNKEARRKAAERLRAQEVARKKQERELALVRKYALAARKKELLRSRPAALPSDDRRNPKLMRKRRLGKVALPRDRLVLQLPDELSESLRTLKPEGNLLSERFRSLRERGIVETRAPVVAKKAKKVETEKWSYKDFK